MPAFGPDWQANQLPGQFGQIGNAIGTFMRPPSNAFSVDTSSYADAIRKAQAEQGLTGQDQQSQIRALQAQAAGNGPSVAQGMLNQATQGNINAGAAALGSARSVNPAMAARLAVQNQVGAGQMAAGQGATMRAQEMLGAQGALQAAMAQKRGQDLGMYGEAGGMQNAGNAINAGVAGQNATLDQHNKEMWLKAISGGIAGGASAMTGMPGGGAPEAAPDQDSGLMAPQMMAHGGMVDHGLSPYVHAILMRGGGKVPGRASVAGNSTRNDTVTAKLSPGEIVLPRTVAKGGPNKAAEFVAALGKRTVH